MAGKVFIDTGAFYARYVVRDDFHSEAQDCWTKIQEKRDRCVTTNFVLAELVTLLVRRFGTPRALLAAREIYGSHAIHIVPVTLAVEMSALDWLERYPDQDFSMTDATSFAVMSQERIKIALTFDRHFEIAGFRRFH